MGWGMCGSVLGTDLRMRPEGLCSWEKHPDAETALLCRTLSTCFERILVPRVGRSSLVGFV